MLKNKDTSAALFYLFTFVWLFYIKPLKKGLIE